MGNDNEQSCEEESVTTNALLVSLFKRLDRQEKRLSQMQQKIDQAAMPSSSSSGRTPNRASRRKEVPLEVRVSLPGMCTCISVYMLQHTCKQVIMCACTVVGAPIFVLDFQMYMCMYLYLEFWTSMCV